MLRFLISFVFTIVGSKRMDCWGNSTAGILFSVPESHHLCLQCGGLHSPGVEWTHEDRKIPVTWRDHYGSNGDLKRYMLGSNGSLIILDLEDSDSGEYRCNERLVAEVQVLSGHDFSVAAGRTLLLPCRSSFRPRQRWFHRTRERGKGELIFTWFRNGTWKPERDGSRLSFWNGALQIPNVQQDDAGDYLCNGNLLARLTVLTVQPDPTSILETSKTSTPGVQSTDDKKRKEKKKPKNVSLSVLMMVAVVGLGLMIILLVIVCVLLICMRCRRKKKGFGDLLSPEDTELQPWKPPKRNTEFTIPDDPPPLSEETIHYASLGRKNWRERPCRTPPDQNHHNVIYSAVITRPAAR